MLLIDRLQKFNEVKDNNCQPMVDENFSANDWQSQINVIYWHRRKYKFSQRRRLLWWKLIFIGCHIYRLQCAKCQVYIVFDAHPISGVLFVCQTSFWHSCDFMHPLGCFLFFVESPRVWVKRKIRRVERRNFMISTFANIFELEQERRRCPWRD